MRYTYSEIGGRLSFRRAGQATVSGAFYRGGISRALKLSYAAGSIEIWASVMGSTGAMGGALV